MQRIAFVGAVFGAVVACLLAAAAYALPVNETQAGAVFAWTVAMLALQFGSGSRKASGSKEEKRRRFRLIPMTLMATTPLLLLALAYNMELIPAPPQLETEDPGHTMAFVLGVLDSSLFTLAMLYVYRGPTETERSPASER